MLIDTAEIKIKAGKGGDGCLSFLREKGNAFGGPNGGDGGNGGDVYLVVDHNLATLMDFRSREQFAADNGRPGEGKKMHGANGNDLYVKVPVGTLVYEIDGKNEVLIGDLVKDGESILVAKGGRGGKGNAAFKSSINQAPRKTTRGTLGEEKLLRLEVKLIADVGLVGLPNAGKSTLINQMTSASAKIANYPFTTLFPNLGTCELRNGRSVVIADIPGLIEGASQGKGLGDDFLRHVERTRVLVHVVEPHLSQDPEDIVSSALSNYNVIRSELKLYKEDLLEKPEIVVINKIDITEIRENFDEIRKGFEEMGLHILGVSAATGEGVEELKSVVTKVIEESPEPKRFEVSVPVKRYNISNLPNRRMVFRIPDVDEGR